MKRLACALTLLFLVSCKEKTPPPPAPPPPPASQPAPPPPAAAPAALVVGTYPPLPANFKPVGCVVVEFTDKTGQKLGPAATDQLHALANASNRFRLMDWKEFMKRRAEQDPTRLDDPLRTSKPGQIPGVDWFFIGSLIRFNVTAVKSSAAGTGAPRSIDTSSMIVKVEIGLELKFVNAMTGELLAKQAGESARENKPQALGLRIFGIGANGALQIDPDSQARLLRTALDEVLKKMLPDIDDKFSK
jgi:curli biogenesis system outer membrane secretion channel CsgG